MSEIVIVVPLAPPRALLPNVRRQGKGGAHWSVQSSETDGLRWAAKGAAVNAMSDQGVKPFDNPVIVSYDVVWPRTRYGARRPFPDNDAIPSAAKAVLDGFIDAGVIKDDSPEFVVEVRAKGRRGDIDEDGKTIVTITEFT